MNRRPLAKCFLRLFALVIMFGGLMILISGQKASADGCDTAYSSCVYDCQLRSTSSSDFLICRRGCDMSYEACRLGGSSTSPSTDPGGDTIPTKLPVIDRRRSWCLSGCSEGASQIPDMQESINYYMACWDYCNTTYPKPSY
jgi:hypothetical protein